MKVINLEDIRTPQYRANCDRYGDDGCIICGRPLNDRDMDGGHWVHMLPNGDITDSNELDGKIPDNHDLGWWQVGNTCYKNYLRRAIDKPGREWLIENNYTDKLDTL